MTSKIESITKGSQIIDQIFWELFKLLKSEKSLMELDLARHIKRIGKHLAFPPIVSFGKNSAEIHHKPNSTKIGRGNFLMLDYGMKVNGYCSDFTRTLFIGKPNKFHEKTYNTVLKAELAAIKQIEIGADCRRIDLTTRKIISRAGFPNYRHRAGHGLGRKIHESPRFGPDSTDRLSKNDIVTIEPGIYLPGRFGVRIEDMILVSKDTHVFSKVPKDLKSMII